MSQNDLSRSPAAGGGLKLVCSLDLVLISDPHLKEFIFLIIPGRDILTYHRVDTALRHLMFRCGDSSSHLLIINTGIILVHVRCEAALIHLIDGCS